MLLSLQKSEPYLSVALSLVQKKKWGGSNKGMDAAEH